MTSIILSLLLIKYYAFIKHHRLYMISKNENKQNNKNDLQFVMINISLFIPFLNGLSLFKFDEGWIWYLEECNNKFNFHHFIIHALTLILFWKKKLSPFLSKMKSKAGIIRKNKTQEQCQSFDYLYLRTNSISVKKIIHHCWNGSNIWERNDKQKMSEILLLLSSH